MSSSCSKTLLVFLLLLASLFSAVAFSFSCFLDPRRHSPPPRFFRYDDDTDECRSPLTKPWVSIYHQHLTQTLANTTGFRIASGILEKLDLTSLLLVDEIHTGATSLDKILVPNCDGITINIAYLEKEDEILEKNPEIMEEIISGKRRVLKELVKKVVRFDGVGNLSVSHPFVYSDDEGEVVVHGVDFKSLDATEREINKLSVYPRKNYEHDYAYRPMTVAYGVDGFESWETPLIKSEEEFIKQSKMKIEMVIVASVVPTPQDIGGLELDWLQYLDMPHKMTMLYILHF